MPSPVASSIRPLPDPPRFASSSRPQALPSQFPSSPPTPSLPYPPPPPYSRAQLKSPVFVKYASPDLVIFCNANGEGGLASTGGDAVFLKIFEREKGGVSFAGALLARDVFVVALKPAAAQRIHIPSIHAIVDYT
jgi:hypothetical protein